MGKSVSNNGQADQSFSDMFDKAIGNGENVIVASTTNGKPKPKQVNSATDFSSMFENALKKKEPSGGDSQNGITPTSQSTSPSPSDAETSPKLSSNISDVKSIVNQYPIHTNDQQMLTAFQNDDVNGIDKVRKTIVGNLESQITQPPIAGEYVTTSSYDPLKNQQLEKEISRINNSFDNYIQNVSTQKELQKRDHIANQLKDDPDAQTIALQTHDKQMVQQLGTQKQQMNLGNTAFKQRQLLLSPEMNEYNENLKKITDSNLPDFIKNQAKDQLDKNLVGTENASYQREKAGYESVLNTLGMKYNDLRNQVSAGHPELMDEMNNTLLQYNDFKTKYDNLDNSYPDVRIANTARIIGDQISKTNNGYITATTAQDVRNAAAQLKKENPEWYARYGGDVDYLAQHSNLIPMAGFPGGVKSGLYAIGKDVETGFGFGQDKFQQAAEDVGEEINPAIKGTKFTEPTRIIFDNDDNAYKEIPNEDYGNINWNSSMRFLGKSVPSLAEFMLLDKGLGNAAKLVGEVGVDGLLSLSENAAKLKGVDITAEELNAAKQALSIGEKTKHNIGLFGALTLTGHEQNRKIADDLINDNSSSGEMKKTILANALNLSSFAAFKAVGITPTAVIEKALQRGIANDALTMFKENGWKVPEDVAQNFYQEVVVPKLKSIVKTVGKNAFEGAKLGAANVLDENSKALIGSIANPNKATIPSLKDDSGALVNNIIMMTAAGLPGIIDAGFTPTTKDALYDAGMKPVDQFARIQKMVSSGEIDQDKANQMISMVKTINEEVNKVQNATNDKGLPLTTKQKRDIAVENFRKRAADQLAAENKVDGDKVNAEADNKIAETTADNRFGDAENEPIVQLMRGKEVQMPETGDDTQTILNRVNNAEYINENDIAKAENDLYDQLDKHPEAAHLIEPLISKIQNYEFTTKSQTRTVTEKVPTGRTNKTQKAEIKPALELSVGSPVSIEAADGSGARGTLSLRSGQYVIDVPQGEQRVIGEKAITDRDLALPPENEMANPIAMDKDGNVESVTFKTKKGDLVTIHDPEKALDIAIQLQADALGDIPDEAFNPVYDEVKKEITEEVPKYDITSRSKPKTNENKKTEEAEKTEVLKKQEGGKTSPSLEEGKGEVKPEKIGNVDVSEHGEDVKTAKDQENGIENSPLTKDGRDEGKDLGKYVADNGQTNIVSSEVQRAKQTAEAAAKEANNILGEGSVKTSTNSVLNTADIGADEGKPDGTFKEKDWTEGKYLPKDAETFKSFTDRMKKAYEFVKTLPETTHVVTHSKVMRALKALDKTGGEWTDDTTKDFLKSGEKPEPEKKSTAIGFAPYRSTEVSSRNEPPKPPKKTTTEKTEGEDNWSGIRKARLEEEIKGAKKLFKDNREKIPWSQSMEDGLREVAARYPEKPIYEAARSMVNDFAAKYDNGESFNPTTNELAVMQYLKAETADRMKSLEGTVQSSSDAERMAASNITDGLKNDLLNITKAINPQEAGRAFAFRQSEIRNDPEHGLQIRRMDLMNAKGAPLTDEEMKWTQDQWNKERDILNRENDLKMKGQQEEFDRRMDELKKDYEQKLKEARHGKPESVKGKTLSQSGKDVADKIRNLKIDKGGLKMDFTLGTWDLAIEGIAKLVEAGSTIAEAIDKLINDKEIGFKNDDERNKFENTFVRHLNEQAKRDDAINKITELSGEGKATGITNDMVKNNLIKDFVDSHIGKVAPNEILSEAAKELQKTLPDVTEDKLREAYLKQGDYKQPTKRSLEMAIRKSQEQLKSIAKKQLTADQQQKIKLQQQKDRTQSDINQFKERLESGDVTPKEEPVGLNRHDAELIKLEKERNDLEAQFKKRQLEYVKKNQSWVEKTADFIRGAYVAALIGAPKTFAKVAVMSLARPLSEATTKLTAGKIFDQFFPNISTAARRGGESSSVSSVMKGFEAYFAQRGEKGLQRLYKNGEKEYSKALDDYNQYKNTGSPDPKKLKALENEKDSKLLKAVGNTVYQFIGGSSFKDAYKALVNRTNEIENLFGGIMPEKFKEGNLLDKANYLLNFVGRSHSALKTFSGRFSFASGFMSRIEQIVKDGEGNELTNSDRLLEVAHESYLDWERGKYQQNNAITDAWNKMLSAIARNNKDNPKFGKYQLGIKKFLQGDVAITRVPLNILHEATMEYTLGAFRAIANAIKTVNKSRKEAINDYGFDPDSQEFKDKVKELISNMDENQAASIARAFRKGTIGLGMYALAANAMAIKFGVFPHKGQKKKKPDEMLDEGEVNPGQIMFGNNRLGETMSAVISHIPALWTTFMGLGITNIYQDDIDKGKSKFKSASDAVLTHLKVIEEGIPQANIKTPSEYVKNIYESGKKRLGDFGLIDNSEDQPATSTKGIGTPRGNPASY